jgi:YVTN family beta-propeller protein
MGVSKVHTRSLLAAFVFALVAPLTALAGPPYAYVPSFNPGTSNSLNVIDLNAHQVVATVPVGLAAQYIAVDPSKGTRIYVGAAGTITVVEATSNTVVATFHVLAVTGMAIDDTGSRLFVSTNVASGQLHVLDAHTGQELGNSPVAIDENPGLLAFDPVQKRVYVTHSHATPGPSPTAIAGTVDVWDVSGAAYNQVGGPITVGKEPRAIDVSADGSHVYVANMFGDSISDIDTSNDNVTTVPTISPTPRSLAVNPADGHAFVAGLFGSSICPTIGEYDGSSMGSFAIAPSIATEGLAFNATGTLLVSVDEGATFTGCPPGPPNPPGDPANTVTIFPVPYSGSNAVAVSVPTPMAYGKFIGPDTIAYTPNAPTAVSAASPTHNQATVSFTPPAADPSGLPVTQYTVTVTDNTPADTLTVTGAGTPTGVGNGLSITVAGLQNDGQPYTFTVFATNANGDGAISAPSNSVTPMSTVAGPPKNVSWLPDGSGQVSISFDPPDDLGGGSTLSYSVQVIPGNAQVGYGSVSPILAQGLTNGTHYDLVIAALNNRGLGPSTPVGDVMPEGPPTQPTITSTVAGNGQATIFFNPPQNDGVGGSTPLTYTVTSSPGGFTASGSGSPLTVTGLTNHTPYTFTVVATNTFNVGTTPTQGTSPPSNPSDNTIPFVTPDPPTNVAAAVSGDGAMRITCTAPASQGESTITNYTVTRMPGGVSVNTGTAACNAIMASLTVGTSYTFTAVAVTPLGPSPASAPSSAVTAATTPGAPTGVAASLTNARTAQITFTPPASDGFSPITDYIVRSVHTSDSVHASASPATMTGLQPGVTYDFTVSAVNAAGEGSASAPSNDVGTPVAAPSGLHVMGGDGQIAIAFIPPPSPGPSAITSYVATSSPGGISALIDGNNPARFMIVVPGLANGTAYTFTVTTNHADGSSETSVASASITPAKLGPRVHPWAYVASESDNMVAVIDTSTDRVINTIDVGDTPTCAVTNHAGTRVYTANLDSVSVIDTASQSVVATIPVPDGPFGIAVNPAGTRVYVANFDNPTVTVIDATANTVIASIPLPDTPLGIDVDSSGNSIYVGFPNSFTIVRIDAGTNTIAATSAPLDVQPAGIEAQTSGPVYVADYADGQVATLNGVVQQSVTSFPDSEPGAGIVMDPASGQVYFTRDPQTSHGFVNQLGGGSAPVGGQPLGIAVTPTGSKLYVSNRLDGTVTAVDATTMTPLATIPVGYNPFSVGRFIAPADLDPPRLGAISTRMQVLTGDNVLIGGFIVGGSTPKTVVVRARGPSLASSGISNFLANPQLQLVYGDSTVLTNDDWQSAGNAADILASGFAPADAHESAIMVTLQPGPYTAIVSGSGGGTGVGLVEVFEVDHPENPMAGISTRGFVSTGDSVMIGGIIIQGDSPQKVVVRARGPSLASQGVANPLSNPLLQLVTSDGTVLTNDDWQSAGNAADIQASGFAPSDPRESAILVTLPPGAYTAIVSGVGGATGVGIVEVFAQ